MPENPFIVGKPVPVDKFIKRTSDLDKIFGVIKNRACLSIHGSSSIGKSSLLGYVATPEVWTARSLDPSLALIIWLNCSEIRTFTAIGFWEQVLKTLKKKIPDNSVIQSVIDQLLQDKTYTVYDLRDLLGEIGKANKFLVLLLDEFGAALYPNSDYNEDNMRSFLSDFRSLTNNGEERQYITVIVTTLRRISDMGPKIITGQESPWHNHYEYYRLKPLTKEKVKEWLQTLSVNHSLPWLLNYQDEIQELSGGHPKLLQSACSLLYRAFQDKDIRTVIDFARQFEQQNRQHFSVAWGLLTDEEKTLLKFLALSRLEGRLNGKRKYTIDGVDTLLSQKDIELRVLEEQAILLYEEETYDFISPIMEWWVIKEIENSPNQPELSQREIAFLNISRKQTAQMKTILEQVWQHKDTIQSIAGWMGKMGGKFVHGFINPGA